MAIKLQTVGIIAADMGKTLGFYRTLGLPIPEGLDNEFNVDYETPDGPVMGFLTEAAANQAVPSYTLPDGQSMSLQFRVNSPKEVDDLYTKLIAAGYESYSVPRDAFWGQRFGRVKDPDGRIVNIYAHLTTQN
ncbi:MAG: VOC family protein [Rhizobacter sp.]|nr:VOC family protein [Chlorobiales bacterium]